MDESKNEKDVPAVTLGDLLVAAIDPSVDEDVLTGGLLAYARQYVPGELMDQYEVYISVFAPLALSAGKDLVTSLMERKDPKDKAYDKGAVVAKYIDGLMASGMTVDQAISVYETVEYAKTSRMNLLRLPKAITVNMNNK